MSKSLRTNQRPSLFKNGVITVKLSTALSATLSSASRVETSDAWASPVWGNAAAIALGGGGIVTTATAVSLSGSFGPHSRSTLQEQHDTRRNGQGTDAPSARNGRQPASPDEVRRNARQCGARREGHARNVERTARTFRDKSSQFRRRPAIRRKGDDERAR